MSRRANCWDNAVAESVLGRLKTERGDTFQTDYEARRSVYEYIDIFYNHIRIHTRHDMAPLKFERQELLAAYFFLNKSLAGSPAVVPAWYRNLHGVSLASLRLCT